jgi:cytochrome c oxidase cbb3-type subunit 2
MADVAAAAAAMGIPESLVQRSVAARAAESGVSVDDLLTEWAGGEAAPAPAPAETETTPEEQPETETPEAEPEPAAPEAVIDVPAQPEAPTPEPAPAGPYEPPVLVGARDNPMTILAGVIGLFVIVVMVGLVGPSIPVDEAGARSSELPYSEAALDGQHIYEITGCAACHTQVVRPIVADIGLGPVSLSDTNQVLATTRFGPDLSDVGNRLTGSQIEATIGGLGAHPSHSLNETDLSNLVAYLVESTTSLPETEEESP